MKRLVQISRSAPDRLGLLRAVAALAGSFAVLVFAGCDRNVAPYEPGDAKQPDLSRIFPDSGEHDHSDEAAAAGRETVAQETSRAGSARGDTISGEVTIASGAAPEGATLFIIARPKGATAGPPLAVLRVPSPRFPFSFELSQANVMIPSMRFDGEMDVSARLDVDGNAMTRDAADLEGRAAGSHAPGASGLTIALE